MADRDFLEVDVDNFDSRLKSMKPRVAFQVPNTLTGEGNLNVDITFESIDYDAGVEADLFQERTLKSPPRHLIKSWGDWK